MLGSEPLLKLDELTDHLMRSHDGLDDLLLGDLPHMPFHHGDGGLGPGHGDIHIPFVEHLIGRVYHHFAILKPHLDPGDGPLERGRGDHQGRRGPHHGCDLRRTVLFR